MKKGAALLLALLLAASMGTATADVLEEPAFIFKESTEVEPVQLESFDDLPSGTEYTVLRTLDAADETLPWSAAWMENYVLQEISYLAPDTNAQEQGWMVTEVREHSLDKQPELTEANETVFRVPSREDPAAELCFAAISKLDQGQDVFTSAGAGDMIAADAFRLALDAIMQKYGETEGQLLRFELSYGFRSGSKYFDGPYWQFDLRSKENPLDSYEVMVYSPSGELALVCGPREGNG